MLSLLLDAGRRMSRALQSEVIRAAWHRGLRSGRNIAVIVCPNLQDLPFLICEFGGISPALMTHSETCGRQITGRGAKCSSSEICSA